MLLSNVLMSASPCCVAWYTFQQMAKGHICQVSCFHCKVDVLVVFVAFNVHGMKTQKNETKCNENVEARTFTFGLELNQELFYPEQTFSNIPCSHSHCASSAMKIMKIRTSDVSVYQSHFDYCNVLFFWSHLFSLHWSVLLVPITVAF